jgi:hypothetical protein
MESILFYECSGCGKETRALARDSGKPDMPLDWCGIWPICCGQDAEVYACCQRCLSEIAGVLGERHESQEVVLRRVHHRGQPVIDMRACASEDNFL